MTDMDVSLRLRLVNQLSRPAEEAERDLKDLKKAAEQLGRTKGGDGLAQGLADVGRKAEAAKAGIKDIGREADQARQAISRVDNGAFDGLKTDAKAASTAIGNIGQEAQQARTKLGRMDDRAFAGLKSDAKAAERAVEQIGRAADNSGRKLRQLQVQGRGAVGAYGPSHGRAGGALGQTASAAFDRLGGDAFIPLGAGAAYMAGGVVASGALMAGAAVRGAANDEFTSDQLRVLGGYGEAEQARYDKLLAAIGGRRGVGSQGAMGVFGGLMAGGLSDQDAGAMTDNAIVFAKATQADVGDAAATTIALRNNLGIRAEDMMSAYDAMALGGKEGQFEVPDMARNFPSLAAKMAAVGESGLQGVKGLVAMAQAIRSTAGTSDEAATNFENMLDKFTAPDFVDGAKEIGINVEKTFKKAKEEGVSPVLALIEQLGKKVGSNPFKLAELLPDRQARAGVQAVLNDLKGVRRQIDNMGKSQGTVFDDYAKATDNFSSAFDRLTSNIAERAKFLGTSVLPPLTDAMNKLSKSFEDIDARAAGAEAISGGDKEIETNTRDEFYRRYKNAFQMNGDKSDLWMLRAGKAWEEALQQKGRGEIDDVFAPVELLERDARLKAAYKHGYVPGRGPENTLDANPGTGEIPTPGTRPDQAASRLESYYRYGTGREHVPSAINAVGNAVYDRDGGISLRPDQKNSVLDQIISNVELEGGEEAKEEAESIADYIKSILGFTVSPTVKPTFISPDGGGSGGVPAGGGTGQQSSVQNSSSNVKLTQNISSPNSRMAAIRAQREANRNVRMAQSRALGDIGPRTA